MVRFSEVLPSGVLRLSFLLIYLLDDVSSMAVVATPAAPSSWIPVSEDKVVGSARCCCCCFIVVAESNGRAECKVFLGRD